MLLRKPKVNTLPKNRKFDDNGRTVEFSTNPYHYTCLLFKLKFTFNFACNIHLLNIFYLVEAIAKRFGLQHDF